MLVRILTIILVWTYASAAVVLKDNGYEGVVAAIDEGLSVDYCQQIIRGLEALMISSSDVIFTATRGRASFRKVTVLIPSAWNPSLCPILKGNLHTASGERWESADVRVTEGRHPHFGSRPWTLQSRGCAQQGDYISLGYESLLQNEYGMGRYLAHSWLKYRYGVFDEVGTEGSTTYPLSHRSFNGQWVPNACTSSPLDLENICNITDASCAPDVTSFEDKNLRGSFMAFPEVESIKELCDEGTHDADSPTPHNIICGAKSVWEILRASPDFQNNRNVEGLSKAENIEFTYVKPNDPRMVILVEDTNIMNAQKRWDFMRKAVRKFVNYDIPDNFKVGLVVFDSVASVKYPLKSLADDDTRENLGSSLPRNPSRIDKHRRCVFCGLEESLKMLRTNENTDGSHLVLVLAGSGHVDIQELNRIERLLSNTSVVLHIIIYPSTERYPEPGEGIEFIGAKTGGLVFTVPDESIGSDSKIIMYYNLLDCLYHTLSAAAGENVLPVKVHSAEHAGGLLLPSKGTFWIDDGLGSDTVFTVFYYDIAHVGDSIHLISPHAQVIDTGNMQSEDDNMNMITVRLRKNQEAHGLWHYELENRADSHQALFVQVTSKPNKIYSKNNVMVRAWTNQPGTQINATNTMKPFIIFAEIKAGVAPIEEAKVTVILKKLGFNSNGTSSPIRLPLYDNGLLNPDLKQGDGVYSRYIYGLSAGKYSMTVSAEGNLRSNKFIRHVRLSVIDVITQDHLTDVIPPSRITNLRTMNLPINDGRVSFAWTAPGDDYDYGQAESYIVLINKDIRNLRDRIGDVLEDWPSPLKSYDIQQHTIVWRNYDVVYYLAMYAVDSSGNAASLSNIVEIFVPSPLPATSTTVTLQSFSETHLENIIEKSDSSGKLSTRQLLIILGCIVTLLLILMFGLFYWTSIHKNKRRTDKENEQKDSFKVSVTVGGAESFSHEKQPTKDALKPDYLRHVNSWSASEVLGSAPNKRGSISGQSDTNSDHSGCTKKNYNYYTSDQYPYDETDYGHSYPANGYSHNIESSPPNTTNTSRKAKKDDFTDRFEEFGNTSLSELCHILPENPSYFAYPVDNNVKEEAKVPPPIPPKPKVSYTPEQYIYDKENQSDLNYSNASINSETRDRNVTMV